MKFKKNLHIAKRINMGWVIKQIKNYPARYETPKYLLFMKWAIENKYLVKLYRCGVSKYIFLIKDNDVIKIRFSNHKPIKWRELEEDCDYYVGISNLQTTTTDQIINKISKFHCEVNIIKAEDVVAR